MEGPFHPGELELQRRAGVSDEARNLGRIIGRRIPAGAARFLAQQRFAVASSLEAGGRVWASFLTGPAGFIRVVDPELLLLAASPVAGDPLASNLAARAELGLLVLDPCRRLRLRFNGRSLVGPEGIFLRVEQAYGNCPKYIQRRAAEGDARGATAGAPRISDALAPDQQEWIRRADTLFIASFHPRGGADASHRGGFPGFVRVLDSRRLAFDDYPGNGMFNTLGNLLAYPPAGLLVVDFASGDLLQIAARARVGADFSVDLEVESVRESSAGGPLRFRLVEYSPEIPAPSHLAPGGISSR